MANTAARKGRVNLTLEPGEVEKLKILEPYMPTTTWANAHVRRYIDLRSRGRFLEDVDENELLILRGIRALAASKDGTGARVIELVGLATRSDAIRAELAAYRQRLEAALGGVHLQREAGPQVRATEPKASYRTGGKGKG